MAKKPEILHELRQVYYDQDHWDHLSDLRENAIKTMRSIESMSVTPYVYGSVARGDISKSSDIDIIILHQVSSYRLELVLGQSVKRELVQATPSMVLKGHIHLPRNIVVSFPLFKMRPREEEFYRWGGIMDATGLESNLRVLGVDKRLILIEPTDYGHIEQGVIGHEVKIAKRLEVSTGIARERVRVLSRRDNVGRTGVYLTRNLDEDESFEEVAKQLQDSDPALRRTIERRKRRR
ncbi:MAG: nucleotidyltransferase domain-containing protein [Candidatus Thorarchaeota archaeon]